jgi:prevent-host-death family protein
LPRKISVAEAKAHFADCVRKVEGGEPVLITRHGKPVVALVPAHDLEMLRRLRAAGPEGGLASLAGGWKGSKELVEVLDRLRRTGPRGAPRLD